MLLNKDKNIWPNKQSLLLMFKEMPVCANRMRQSESEKGRGRWERMEAEIEGCGERENGEGEKDRQRGRHGEREKHPKEERSLLKAMWPLPLETLRLWLSFQLFPLMYPHTSAAFQVRHYFLFKTWGLVFSINFLSVSFGYRLF